MWAIFGVDRHHEQHPPSAHHHTCCRHLLVSVSLLRVIAGKG